MSSVALWLGGSAATIFAFYYTQIGLRPNVELLKKWVRFPEAGTVKMLKLRFALRNRRKHVVYVEGAEVSLGQVRIKAARNFDAQQVGFTLNADSRVEIATPMIRE